MKRNRKPECKERNEKIDKMDDNELSYCKIYKKRVDREWGSWAEFTEEETLTEWYQIEKRFIFLLEKTGKETNQRIALWLKFILQTKGWVEARDYFLNLGGETFSAVDGTE